MDPNEALRMIREAVELMRETPNTIADADTYERVHRLMDSVEALDEWLSRGGFLPDAWNGAHPARFGRSG